MYRDCRVPQIFSDTESALHEKAPRQSSSEAKIFHGSFEPEEQKQHRLNNRKKKLKGKKRYGPRRSSPYVEFFPKIWVPIFRALSRAWPQACSTRRLRESTLLLRIFQVNWELGQGNTHTPSRCLKPLPAKALFFPTLLYQPRIVCWSAPIFPEKERRHRWGPYTIRSLLYLLYQQYLLFDVIFRSLRFKFFQIVLQASHFLLEQTKW